MEQKDEGLIKWKEVILSRSILRLAGVVLLLCLLLAADLYWGVHKILEPSIRQGISLLRKSYQDRVPAQPVEGGRYAQITLLSGNVSVKRSQGLEWQGAKVKSRLHSGDIIRTYEGASARLAFDDGSSLEIKPDSLVIIGELEEDSEKKSYKSSLQLMSSDVVATAGRVSGQHSQLELKTPTAVASFDDAKVAIKVAPNEESRISVYSGQAKVAAGGRVVALAPGQTVKVSTDSKVSVPTELPAPPRLVSPAKDQVIISRDPDAEGVPMRWEVLSPAIHQVGIEVATEPQFLAPVARVIAAGLSTVIRKAPQGVCYVRLRGINREGVEGDAGSAVRFSVMKDDQPPKVSIDSVMVVHGQAGRDVQLFGHTEVGAELTINGRRLAVDHEGRFRWQTQGLRSAALKILIHAADRIGNKTVEEREISVP